MNDTHNVAHITIDYPGELRFHATVEYSTLNDTIDSVLELVFANYNHGSGRETPDFTGRSIRSLSVGDFVNVDGFWYRCDNSGWSRTDSQTVYDTARQVKGHPMFNDRGPWWCLQDLNLNVA